ncbi:MAG: hypothetical protein IKM28_05020 [Lachnospiraceae bacterium]|nr:hypothetical protein [Lachnospiraceae bacterium]
MKNRKNYLKSRKKAIQWKEIGDFLEKECPLCGQRTRLYVYQYDAVCCLSCNQWLETGCSDPNCEFCRKRPETPYAVYWLTEMGVGSAGRRKDWRRKNYQHKMNGWERKKKQQSQRK